MSECHASDAQGGVPPSQDHRLASTSVISHVVDDSLSILTLYNAVKRVLPAVRHVCRGDTRSV
jgi:hypothetical protein